MPSNLWLLAGDTDLETLENLLSTELEKTPAARHIPFVETMGLLRAFRDKCVSQMSDDVTVFIDCNPALTAYTKIGLGAASCLIVPLNADDYSVEASKKMLRKLYNRFMVPDDHPFFKDLTMNSFAAKAFGYRTLMTLPPIRVVVHNRDPIAVARGLKATKEMRQEVNKILHNEICHYHAEAQKAGFPIIVDPAVHIVGYSKDHNWQNGTQAEKMTKKDITCLTSGKGLQDFAKFFTCPLKDLTSSNTASVHLGIPIWSLLDHKLAIKQTMDGLSIEETTFDSNLDGIAELLRMMTNNPKLPNGKDLKK